MLKTLAASVGEFLTRGAKKFLAQSVFNKMPKAEMKPDKIIVGLGNPGSKYRETRHKIGYMVLSELVKRTAFDKPRNQFHAEVWEVRLENQNVLLLFPTTFMNLSGTSVAEAVRFYKLNPISDLMVVCDDLDLPLGRLRIRESAGCGGQKGLKDIVAKLGTQNFPRIRVGIGRPASQDQVVDFVLTSFRSDERPEVDIAIKRAADALILWVKRDIQTCMNQYNVAAK